VINLTYGDTVQFTVEIEGVDASIAFCLNLVSREVSYAVDPIKENVLGEVLIGLRFKKRRFRHKGARTILSGLRGITVTDVFCDKLVEEVRGLIARSIADETVRLI